MKPIQVKDNVYWVGGIDWNIRTFHGYLTPRGMTYNAYLIVDEKITLIDTVKHYMFEEMIERISAIVDPSKIDYVVSNHVEMDHSGALPKLMEICPQAVVFTSVNGEKGLKAHYRPDWNFRVMKSGETINLGRKSLAFVHTPMVHWPDNMVTYCPEDKILFSNDAFGQHIASTQRFDEELPCDIIIEEAARYYANIVLPYGAQVGKALEALRDIAIEIIAPSHGLVWRTHIPEILREYEKWASGQTEEKAVIVYDTMWGSTEKIAYAVQNAFENAGIPAKLMRVTENDISDIMPEVLMSKYVCVGSPTLNNGIMPKVSAFLTYMKGLAPKNRIGVAFGSYGWGGQSVGIIEGILKECHFELLENVRIQFIPEKAQLQEAALKLEGILNDQIKTNL
ncbi:flavodoxin/nitric oxide synthase [Syntrophobotulus glycolicus DSM 8271]|uniref:Flavodoxin/nitric oxide synthase n=1 Tax=Syntrophobotulus glycolicus (strain DSM 8271 / FlGlyR) TaxID=645991 RepID=F0T0E2_SYNGF|nr:FprA family A-type flavoprotein [Syntrophobotulus glycolicus]ADY57314.1 flavodoxin/nitric oxide synthase [Syntrophobotulus glycolicus DSM 8271]